MNKAYRIFLIFTTLFLFHGLSAQPDLNVRISLNLDNATLENTIDVLSRAAKVEFSYSPRKIDLSKNISLDVNEQTLENVLDTLSKQAGLAYLLVENHIVLKPARKNIPIVFSGPALHTLSGYIRDEASNEALIGANIYVASLEKGAVSNEFGFYSLTIPGGQYEIEYSYVGYKPFTWKANLVADQFLNITLNKKAALMEEVMITLPKEQMDLSKARTGNVILAPGSVEKMPAFFGEQDVIKSLDALPGIHLLGDGSTLFSVRGGNKDQNLILLDDAPIYNPAHFLGLFSTFTPEAVKDISIYKGDIPAEYGGRLSSLIDVRTKDGNMNKFAVHGSMGLIAGRASVEGPISRGKSSFFISGRTSYIKWYLKSLSPDIQKFNFYDLNAKFNFRLGMKDRIYLSGYAGQDYFSQGSSSNTSGISWSNIAGTLRWNHIFNERLFSNTTIYSSKYDYFLITSVEQNDAWNSSIANVTLKSDFTWYASPDMNIRFGGKRSRHHFNPGNFELGTDPLNPFLPVVSRKSARETAFYISNHHTVFPALTIRYGLRLSSWSNIGEATEYEYIFNIIQNDLVPVDTFNYADGVKYHSYRNLEPRLGITLRSGPSASFKASYARTAQYLQLVTNSISPFTTLEIWLPGGPHIKPQKGDQVSLGYFRKFPSLRFDLSLETFYKKLHNQIDYEDHAYILLNPHIERELRFGSAEAFGMEIMLNKYLGKLTGWIGYSLSHSDRKIEGINNNDAYPASWDRPHDLNLFLSYDLTERWAVSANWIYMSGSAFSSPTGFYRYNGYTVPIYDRKNNDRLPDYHRMDLSSEIRLNRKEGNFSHSLRFTLYNLYSRKNPFAINFNKTLNREGTPVVPGDLYLPPELVPTQMYLFEMVPAISYSFTIK